MFTRIGGHIGDHAHGWSGRANVCAARQVFFDNVVLHGALQGGYIDALFFGHCDVERQQPRCSRVDRHGCVHLVKRDIGEQCTHVAKMADGHADFADLTVCQNVIAVIASLGRQIEGHGKPRLPFGQITAIKRVGGGRRGVPSVGPKQPRAIFLRVRHGGLLGERGEILFRMWGYYPTLSGAVNSLHCGMVGFTPCTFPVSVPE